MQVVPAISPLIKLLENNIRIVAVLVSFALSAWAVYSNGVVNRDGILYLQAAAQLEQGQWTAALALYNWLLYPGLIALTGQLTGLTLEASAQLLNGLLFGLTVYAFISLVKELGGNNTTLIAAALVILVYPELNEQRAAIFRDNGYWAFYLLSVWLFIKYFKTPCLRYAWAWGASIIITLLFRIEGMAFLFLLPLALMLKRDMSLSRRFLALAGAYLIWVAGLFLLLIGWTIDPEIVSHNIGRLNEPFGWLGYLWRELGSHLQEQAARLSDAILNRYSDNYALHAVIATLATILVLGVFSALGAVYTVLVVHSFMSRTFRSCLPADMRGLVIWLIIINLVVLSVFLIKAFFLAGRYPMPLALTLMLILPFHLVVLKDRWRASRLSPAARKACLTVIAFLVLAVTVDGLITFGPSKQYLKAAGVWIAREAPVDAKLYTNDGTVAYYAGSWQATPYAGFDEVLRQLHSNEWRNFDYLAIHIKKRDKALEAAARQAVGHVPVKTFINNRGEKVLIFRTQILSGNR